MDPTALTDRRTKRTATAARVVAFALCSFLVATGGGDALESAALVLLGIALVVAAGQTIDIAAPLARLVTLLEATLWAVGVLRTGGANSPLLPYLLAPALVGGLALGFEGVLVPIGVAAVAVLSGAPSLHGSASVLALAKTTGEWVVLALLVGLLASWVHRLQREPVNRYLEAFRLLEQLRDLARALPVGLDRTALANDLLRDLKAAGPVGSRGAVFVRAPGDRPTLLASGGAERPDWRIDLSQDSPFSEAWASQQVLALPTGLSPEWKGTALVLPLVVAHQTIGVVGLEFPNSRQLGSGEIAALTVVGNDAALQLETATVFDELREVATVEERRRLAREIHDGIAQDLAAFGYELDALAGDARLGASGEAVANALLDVRSNLSRLVVELRNSIFELRSAVDQHGGLGAALTEYVRAVGTASNLTVHLSLDEGPERLSAATESELLRIAQEAVTNARKHAHARNLWVRCSVSPPSAELVVEDDGIGPGQQRDGSFGLEIMQERALRLRATLSVTPREPQGTTVTVQLGQQR